MKQSMYSTAVVAWAFTLFSADVLSTAHEVGYPDGFRDWTHVKTGLIGPMSAAFKRFGGFHHIYANDLATKGYRSGVFQDGSILVFDVWEMMEAGDGTIVEGKRKFIDVMIKEGGTYSETGGWGFEEFDGDSHEIRNIKDRAAQQCFACHATQRQQDFVFSKLRK